MGPTVAEQVVCCNLEAKQSQTLFRPERSTVVEGSTLWLAVKARLEGLWQAQKPAILHLLPFVESTKSRSDVLYWFQPIMTPIGKSLPLSRPSGSNLGHLSLPIVQIE